MLFGCVFDSVGSIADWVQIVLIVLGVPWALWQWHRSCKLSRSEHLRDLLNDFYADAVAGGFRDLIDRLDKDDQPVQFYAKESLRFVSGYERAVDQMLLAFSRVCYERLQGVITEDEFGFFAYQIRRTLENEQIQSYLNDLAKFASNRKNQYPFAPLVRIGAKLYPVQYDGILKEIG